jgi:shikimate 5-dehydrogenase
MDSVALLGHPVAGSLWPQAVAALGRLLDRDVKMKAVDVGGDKLAEGVAKLRAGKFAGVVLGAPHKAAGLALAGGLSTEARSLGMANCLKLEADGVKGTTVEAAGFYDVVAESGIRVRDATCQILGGGAAAKAAAYALGRGGAKHVRVWAKKTAEAEAIAGAVRAHWPDSIFSTGLAGPAELWISAASADGEKPEKPPVKALPGAAVAIDLECGKGPTKFLELGLAARARTMSGYSVLVYEAIRSWEFWFGAVGGPGRGVLKSDLMRLKRWK